MSDHPPQYREQPYGATTPCSRGEPYEWSSNRPSSDPLNLYGDDFHVPHPPPEVAAACGPSQRPFRNSGLIHDQHIQQNQRNHRQPKRTVQDQLPHSRQSQPSQSAPQLPPHPLTLSDTQILNQYSYPSFSHLMHAHGLVAHDQTHIEFARGIIQGLRDDMVAKWEQAQHHNHLLDERTSVQSPAMVPHIHPALPSQTPTDKGRQRRAKDVREENNKERQAKVTGEERVNKYNEMVVAYEGVRKAGVESRRVLRETMRRMEEGEREWEEWDGMLGGQQERRSTVHERNERRGHGERR